MASINKPQVVHVPNGPKALGPYSRVIPATAILGNNQVFTSGQLGINKDGELVGSDVQAQTRQALKNLQTILQTANSDLTLVLKTTVFLKDLGDFNAVNEIYAEFFDQHKPARTCIEVARLPKDALVEIECVALVKA
ncbi:hypothetical protein IWQ60_004013 [Tieghemiomyces parasiticus]|uniref:Uncharacterized protein n=1 Tax=Tieghemiomyces parasiticus TaxID=78921 RepID=A0A9W8E055_9FUNG|nr:hypothetical protein IWQ60_004013 [Tieghemiomyces parasiticus]